MDPQNTRAFAQMSALRDIERRHIAISFLLVSRAAPTRWSLAIDA
jgi:hypothetical protein